MMGLEVLVLNGQRQMGKEILMLQRMEPLQIRMVKLWCWIQRVILLQHQGMLLLKRQPPLLVNQLMMLGLEVLVLNGQRQMGKVSLMLQRMEPLQISMVKLW